MMTFNLTAFVNFLNNSGTDLLFKLVLRNIIGIMHIFTFCGGHFGFGEISAPVQKHIKYKYKRDDQQPELGERRSSSTN